MFPFEKKYFPPLFICTIALFPILSVWGLEVFDGSAFRWIAAALNLAFVAWYKKKYFRPANRRDYRIVGLFLLWAVIGIVRGLFVAENYWEWKALVGTSFQLFLPAFVYVFSSPELLQKVFRLWLKYILPLFIIVLSWMVVVDFYHFYLGPLLILGCLIPLFPNKIWKIGALVLLGVMLLGDIGARAQMLKAGMTLLIAAGIWMRHRIPGRLLRIGHWSFYIIPIILLALGISGRYNIFDHSTKYSGRFTQQGVENGQVVVKDLAVDTRTFIYREVIGSALANDYLLWGRTPARGNDSEWFGAYNAEELNTGKYERQMNEVAHPNIFTWLGLIGLVLWSLIYLKSSFLAVYRSRNVFMRFLGVFIAFRFLLGWIEDVNSFNLSGIAIWMLIAMGFSEQFRAMTDTEFKKWVRGCFPWK